MSTAVWSYHPTEGVTETTAAALRGDAWGPRAALYSTTTSRQLKRFELSWGPAVASAECNSMLAFFRARNGSFDSFQWVSPVDGLTHQVRFDSTIKADQFDPGWFRAGAQLAFLETHTPTLTTLASAVVATEYFPGSGGVHPDAGSGDGMGPEAFWFPDAWYVAGWKVGDLSTFGGNTAWTSNLIGAQVFANATSGVALDRLGIVVLSGAPGQYVTFGLYIATGLDGSGLFDAYPGSRVALTSCQVNNAGLAVASIATVPLQDTVYWVSYVTSFDANSSAVFKRLAFYDDTITGQSSGGGGINNGGALSYTHSLSLPTTFPSSAGEAASNPVRVMFHIASVAV